MSERCPLGQGLYWESDSSHTIPAVCQTQCSKIWQTLMDTQPGVVDEFGADPPDCMTQPDYGDTSLIRAGHSASRYASILNECPEHDVEISSETWQFDCPHN